MKRLLPLLLLPALAHASQFATGGAEILLDAGNTPVHVFTESGTLIVTETCFAQLLLVGGGGGGGNDCAAGGGGGGVVEVAAVRLPAGSYAVTVGAGGLGGGSTGNGGNGLSYGSNGGASSIADPSGTILYTALGGGGGGGWSAPPPASSSSAPFASGGGGTNGRSGAAAGDPTQGSDGGSSAGGGSRPAGGGGAGGTAVPAVISWGKNATQNGVGSGNGGPGIWCDITGTNQMYGAGGGGGGYDGSPGAGGDGIGGHGWRAGTTATGDEPGRAGYGGGGGGGNNNRFTGAAGGSGTVILRLTAPTATTPEPVFTWDASTARPDRLAFTFTVTSAGTASTDGTVDVFAEIADAESAWDAATGAFSGTRTALLDDTEIGLLSATAHGLRPSHGYYVRLVVANDGGEEAVSDIRALSTPALVEERWVLDGRTGSPGLWQLQSGAGNNIDLPIDVDAPAVTVQRGAVAAGITNHDQSPNAPYNGGYTDEEGRSWTIGGGITYRYTGWVFLEAGATYNFFGHYWDSIRFDLDGTTRFRSNSTSSFPCTKTGWYKVDLWFGGGSGRLGVVEGWSLGFGWNTNGVTSTSGNPGADWIRFENGCGGDAYLRTVPLGRTVDVSSWSVDSDAGTATFTAALGESWDDTALYAVWGPDHGGEDTNEWAHVAYAGAVGTAAATASFTVPDTSDLTYFRFVAVDDKPLFAWSPGQLVDLSNPAISIVGIEDGGDRATVSVQVDSVGTGDFSLSLLWGGNADLSGASVTNIPVDGPGVYTVVVRVTPGVANYFRAEATTSDGGADATAVDSLTPASASAFDETVFGTSVNKHTVTFAGQLAAFGARDSVVSLWVGESPDALVEDPDAIVVSHLNRFTIQRVYPGWPKKYYWKLVATNTGLGGTSWTVDSEVRSFTTTEWDIRYTWAAGSTDGSWTNAANWTTTTPGALGYPATNTCTAVFPGGTEATIDVPEGVYYVHLDLNTTGSHVVLRGENAETTGFANGDGGGATMAGTTLVLDNLFLEEHDVFDYNIGSASLSQGPVFALTNGAVLSLAGYTQGFAGTNACLSVSEGSALYMGSSPYVRRSQQSFNNRFSSRLLLRAAGEAFRVAGRAMIETLYLAPLDGDNGLTVRLAGPDAQLVVRNGVIGDYEGYDGYDGSGARPFLYDADIVFAPTGPYTNTVAYAAGDETVTEAVPLVSTSDSGRPLGTMKLSASTGKIRLSVDPAGMRNAGSRNVRQHVVLWKGGIDTTNVELVAGSGYALSYTYGWPSVLDAPENAGDLPTGVWADIPSQAGTLIVVK